MIRNYSAEPAFWPFLFFVGLILVAAVSRAPITSIAPLLDRISIDLNLLVSSTGMITTLPLLAFGLISADKGLVKMVF